MREFNPLVILLYKYSALEDNKYFTLISLLISFLFGDEQKTYIRSRLTEFVFIFKIISKVDYILVSL